jgi:hypothetical protein
LVSQVPFADSARVAEEVFGILGPNGELRWQQLPKDRADEMLRQLRDCPSIEDHYITGFLAELSKSQPSIVVDLLKSRVECWEQSDSASDYRALPFHWDHQLHARPHHDFLTILRDILRWIALNPESWQRHQAGGGVFAAVAGGFDADVMSVLDEAITSGDPDQIAAVGLVLRAAPQSLVYDNVDFVRRALAAATQLSVENAQRLGGAMHAAVTTGVRSGTPGEPFSQDIHQRDRSCAIADGLPRGSIEERFYRSLQRSAEHNIQWSADRDEQLVDGRDW